MELSDENDEDEAFSDQERDLFNQKILGYQKDYTDEIVDIEHEKQKSKEKPGNSQSVEAPKVVVPLDMSKLKMADIFKPDREHYLMDQSKLSKIDCQTCKLIYDYTKICPH